MRTYQHIGLKSDALEFLSNEAAMKPDITCPDCNKVITEKMDKEVYDIQDVTFGDVPLHTYNLRDGRQAREIIQCMPWSSGPMGFLCLEIDGALQFQWTDQEIEDYP